MRESTEYKAVLTGTTKRKKEKKELSLFKKRHKENNDRTTKSMRVYACVRVCEREFVLIYTGIIDLFFISNFFFFSLDRSRGGLFRRSGRINGSIPVTLFFLSFSRWFFSRNTSIGFSFFLLFFVLRFLFFVVV